MTTSDDTISEYLTRYADSLTAFDAETAAGLWSTPGMIVNDRSSGVLDSRDAMVDSLRQAYPIYHRLGLASVGFELLERRDLSDRLVLVGVRWLFFDAGGAQLTDTDSYYLLRDQDEAGLQACVCVETDAAEKLQALATARGVDLTSRDTSPA